VRPFGQLGSQPIPRHFLFTEGLEKSINSILGKLQIYCDLVALSFRFDQQFPAGAFPVTERFDELRQPRQTDLADCLFYQDVLIQTPAADEWRRCAGGRCPRSLRKTNGAVLRFPLLHAANLAAPISTTAQCCAGAPGGGVNLSDLADPGANGLISHRLGSIPIRRRAWRSPTEGRILSEPWNPQIKRTATSPTERGPTRFR
jgi:hypothetical protein